MAPIRVGLVGLSTAVPGPTAYTAGLWGQVHLASISASPHYELVALCNSSVESAQKSIEGHKLGPNIRAYGSVEDLAKDPDVDVIVVSVNVSKHYELSKPALLNNKPILVEFPVAATLKETEELVALAEKSNLKSATFSQARTYPAFRKVKELIKSKAIGDVQFTTFNSQASIDISKGWPESTKQSLNINDGVSILKVGFGHGLETFMSALGDFQEVQSVFKTTKKTIPIVNEKLEVVDPAYKVTSPDQVTMQGVLENGAIASLSLRSSANPAADVSLRWIIGGSEGEIDLAAPVGYVQMLGPGAKVLLRKWKGDVEEIDVATTSEPAHVSALPDYVKGIARVYEAYATNDQDGFASLRDGLKTQKVLQRIIDGAIIAP